MVDYVQGLSAGQRKAVAESPGWRTFKFGGGERLKSLKEVTIPAKFGDQPVLLKVDVVESKIPLQDQPGDPEEGRHHPGHQHRHSHHRWSQDEVGTDSLGSLRHQPGRDGR